MVRAFTYYSIVGLGAATSYLSIVVFLVELMFIDVVIASIIAYIPSVIGSYYLNYFWVFRSKQNHHIALSQYFFVISLGCVLNILCIYTTVNILNWWYVYGQLLAFIIVAINNFTLNYLWTFYKRIE